MFRVEKEVLLLRYHGRRNFENAGPLLSEPLFPNQLRFGGRRLTSPLLAERIERYALSCDTIRD